MKGYDTSLPLSSACTFTPSLCSQTDTFISNYSLLLLCVVQILTPILSHIPCPTPWFQPNLSQPQVAGGCAPGEKGVPRHVISAVGHPRYR